MKYFTFFFFYTKSSKSMITLMAHLSLDQLHFECVVAARG